MSDSLLPYPEYKASSVAWLGDIPAHWDVVPLRGMTDVKNERNRPDLQLLSVYRDYGVIPRDSRDDNHNPEGSNPSSYYKNELDEDGQVDFKGKAKGFVRTYNFLASILPYNNANWEKLSIFLNFLVPKLPAPQEEDLSRGILETIDIESYRAEKRATMQIILEDSDAEIEPIPTAAGGFRPEPEIDRLSNIIRAFNDVFGNIGWTDADRVRLLITEEIPARVSADAAFQNARQNSGKQNARIEHDKALARVMASLLKDDTELFKQFSDNPDFRRWLTDTVFVLAYD